MTSPPVSLEKPRAARPRPQATAPPWKLADRMGLAACWAVGIVFCAIAASIAIFMAVQGIRFLRPDLLVTSPAAGFNQSQTGGFLDPLLGTLLLAAMGTAIALPLGVCVAVWLSEYGRPFGLARAAESSIEMIAGAPSVVLAIFGTLIFSSQALGFFSRTTSDGVVFGRSFFAASAIISLIALPLIVASTREGLQAIPSHVREASYAVGKSKIATIRRILLPTARPSIVTGTVLGIGRIVGDTAIVIVLLGATLTFNSAPGVPGLDVLRGTGSTLTTYVYQNSPTGEANQPTKAYAAAFVLLMTVLLLNLCIELIERKWKAPQWNT